MKSKEKRRKGISLKNLIVFFVGILVLLYLLIFYNYFFVKNEVLAKETVSEVSDVKISNKELIDIDEIIKTNTENNSSEEYVTEEIDLEYITKYEASFELPKGVIQVIQEGREGKQEVVTKNIYENGQLKK